MNLLSGQRAFIVQRLSALALLAVLAAALVRLALGPPVSFAAWQAWSAQPHGAALLLFAAAAVLAHAWVGIRDVALDYVRPFALRAAFLAAAAAGLLILGAWTALIVLRHAL